MALSRYCLDTSAYSRFQRGEGEVTDLIDGARWVGLPVIVLGELGVGFALGRHRRRNEETLLRFLSNPAVEVLDVDHQASRHYTDIVIDLRRAGTPIPTNDIWIAATAAAAGAVVLTFDEHFRAVARVGTVLLGAD